MRRIDELRQKKMEGVFDKVNVYLKEYGKKHHYGIIVGTVSDGSIVYGDEGRYDSTEEITQTPPGAAYSMQSRFFRASLSSGCISSDFQASGTPAA